MEKRRRAKTILSRILRLLVGTAAVLCLIIFFLQLLTRPDPARVEQEQRAVFSTYLFEYPLVARPLPTLCADLQRGNNSGLPTRLLISNQTISRLPAPLGIIDLPKEKLHALGVPLSTFNNFFVRNLTPGPVNSIPEPSNVKLEFAADSKISNTQDHDVSIAFSEVGFNHDLSWAMFYAVLSCGTQKGTEYVYLTRDWKHGQYWYVAGVDRLSGSQITEQLPAAGK